MKSSYYKAQLFSEEGKKSEQIIISDLIKLEEKDPTINEAGYLLLQSIEAREGLMVVYGNERMTAFFASFNRSPFLTKLM